MRIAGCGCALADFLYQPVDFAAPAFARLRSKQRGDGGLEPGRLVFVGPLERFAEQPIEAILADLTQGREPAGFNVGGPAIVALALAAQLGTHFGFQTEYHGARGEDDTARRMLELLASAPLDLAHYQAAPGVTPYTLVVSDPSYDHGHGERTFINNLGVAEQFQPDQLSPEFFSADVVCLGATALVPPLHENLTELLQQARGRGAFTVVTTVFDFLNEMRHPGGRWPLGRGASGPLIDLLMMDHEEALRVTGTTQLEAALRELRASGVQAFLITAGPKPIELYAGEGSRFAPRTLQMPVSEAVGANLDACRQGDTTGCGDNFAGGVLFDIAMQLHEQPQAPLDLIRAAAVGICAGGSARFQLGGLAREAQPGAKLAQIRELYGAYCHQMTGRLALPAPAWLQPSM
jgi:sugar/nucleoside kinase (ribokinase family)